MTNLLLSIHVIAAILAIGPITVAASMFPRFVAPRPAGDTGVEERTPAGAALLHQICRGYTVVGIAVPVFGIATGMQMGALGEAWLLISVVLTAIAAALLVWSILPGQKRLLALPPTDPEEDPESAEATRSGTARLAMVTGVFNLLWVVIVVLMIVRPGA
ncbi:DUF2269 family protein [Nocardiopsis kunsanensis]|uniref:DUF2269 family protein n=1 Tax=Nocardiopsis kunsanensis TaxID=141693 RepID=UPI000349C587|nr:DUF2269 family protein [Nocardiopsis kunsanensis]